MRNLVSGFVHPMQSSHECDIRRATEPLKKQQLHAWCTWHHTTLCLVQFKHVWWILMASAASGWCLVFFWSSSPEWSCKQARKIKQDQASMQASTHTQLPEPWLSETCAKHYKDCFWKIGCHWLFILWLQLVQSTQNSQTSAPCFRCLVQLWPFPTLSSIPGV